MPNTLKIKRGTAATIPNGQLAEPLFTSDTYDLYIGKGNGTNQRFQKYIASGTSSQFLKGDGSLDSNTYQTALTFSSPLVNTSGTVTINQSSGSADGYLSSTDWTTFNSKEPAITAGTTSQYYRGDKTFQTLDTAAVPENGAIYFTEPRVRATVLTGLNLSGGGTIAATDSILTAFGKVQNQISALVGGATYQGTWNANTNTPTLASGTGTKGYYYVVSVAGSTNLDGITDWKVGDWAIFNGTTWDKVDNTDAVSSVNGFTGAVNLALDNISDVSAASPTNAQLLRFNGTSSLWENWTPTFEPALTKGNLTEATSSVLTITGGTGAVIGSGTTIAVASAGAAQNGVVTTGTQTFAGAKTFNSDITINSVTAGRGAGNDSSNTVFGNSALGGSTASVAGNTAIGSGSLGSNTSGFGNTALGFGSLGQNTTGQSNTAIGVTAGQLIIGSYNTFVGRQAFSQATSGSNNTIIGYAAGIDITSGSNNTLIGGYTGPASALSGNVIISDGSGNIRFLHNGTNGKLPFLTSNGFVKTSGGDGTLSVDTNTYLTTSSAASTYLPLTGGTLTGALSGTSATFSGNVEIGNTSGSAINSASGLGNLVVGNGGASSQGITIYTGASTYGGLNFADATTGGGAYAGYIKFDHSDNSMGFFIGNVSRLSIASTGAATFSSSVYSSGSLQVAPTTSTGMIGVGDNFGGNMNAGIYRGGAGVTTSGNYLNIGGYDGVVITTGNAALGSQTTRLTISSTGAATFSSSVTAGTEFITSGAYGFKSYFGTVAGGSFMVFSSGIYSSFDGIYQASGATRDFGIWLNGGTINDPKFVIKNGGNVGIGTTAPNRLLDVNGVIRTQNSGSAGAPAIELGTSAQGNGLFYPNTNTIAIATNDTERMRITSGGNVAIGNTTTSNRLLVKGGLFPVRVEPTGSSTDGTSIELGYNGITFNSSAASYKTFTIQNALNDASADLNILNGAGTGITLKNSGNVGIGTTSPNIGNYGANGRILTVQGVSGSYGVLELTSNSANADATAIGRLDFGSDGQASGYKAISSIASFLSGSTSTKYGADLRFYTRDNNAASGDPTERMRITSGGATQIKGTIQTYTIGSTTTLGPTYKWGNRVAGTCSVSTTAYLEVEVGGTIYYLAFANPS